MDNPMLCSDLSRFRNIIERKAYLVTGYIIVHHLDKASFESNSGTRGSTRQR